MKKKKIIHFPLKDDEKIDHLLKEEFIKDADEYEKHLLEDPSLSDIEAPEDLYQKIIDKIHDLDSN